MYSHLASIAIGCNPADKEGRNGGREAAKGKEKGDMCQEKVRQSRYASWKGSPQEVIEESNCTCSARVPIFICTVASVSLQLSKSLNSVVA